MEEAEGRNTRGELDEAYHRPKASGIFESSIRSKLKQQIRTGTHYVFEVDKVFFRETDIIFPSVIRKPAGDMMKAIVLVRQLDIYLHATVWTHTGMNDFGIVVQRHEWMHHRTVPPIGIACLPGCIADEWLRL